MFSYKVDDQWLDSPLNSSVGMIYRGSILDYTSDLGDRSTQLNFPFTATNDKVFKHARFVEVKYNFKQYDCVMYFMGTPMHTGRLVLMKTVGNYQCFFYPSSSSAVNELKLLNEIEEFDEVVNLGTTPTDVIEASHADAPDEGYGWPTLYLPEFYDGKNEYWRNLVNPKTADLGTGIHYTSLQNSIVSSEAQNLYAYAPQLFLSYVLKKACLAIGYEARGDLFLYSKFNETFLFNNKPLDLLEEQAYVSEVSHAVSLGLNRDFRPDFTTVSGGSYIVGGTYSSNYIAGGSAGTFNYKGYEPQSDGTHRITITKLTLGGYLIGAFGGKQHNHRQTIYVKLWQLIPSEGYVMAHVWDVTGSGSTLLKIDVPPAFEPHELQMYNGARCYFEIEAYYLNPGTNEEERMAFDLKAMEVKFENLETTQLNILEKEFNKKELLPDMSVKDLFDGLKKWFGVQIKYNEAERSIRFNRVVNMLQKDEHVDWSAKVLEGDNIDFSQVKNFEWVLPDAKDLGMGSIKVNAAAFTDVVETVSPAISGFVYEFFPQDSSKLLKGVYVHRSNSKAISPLYGLEDNKREFRFVARFGQIVEDSQEPVAEILANAPIVSRQFILELSDIMNLDFSKKIWIHGQSFFLRELGVPFNDGSIGVATAELIKLG